MEIEKCLDLKAYDFKNAINELINSCDLDACIIYYIIKDLYSKVEVEYERILKNEYDQWLEWNKKLQEDQNKEE